ncbi:PQQ-binding-like beta-propeller repeat protein [Nocardiopsis aegyptia]|uniref:Pyrrolo-quinoline quinone n=1 Tax=Nocardiopsis aegyptia TaxID=220378 RepID=A0A7Z0ENY6_9ACTN|nr:hypothetical protein [Nocardiopsis aegyptia]NYJ35549.1 hypothetical protein [Nocardiopsis aegyptia]
MRHEALDGEWAPGEVPGTVTEHAWEWSDEKAEGNVAQSPLPGGVLLRMQDGVVALDGASGEEMWSYRVEGTRVWTDVSASGERVHILFPDEPQEREEDTEAAGDAEEDGSGVPGRRVVLDGVTGEVVGDHEEEISGDVEELGVFDVEVATDEGLFGLAPEPQLDAVMRSDTDDEVLWHTEDLFSCGESTVDRADRPVVFPGAVVVRAVCGSGEAQLTALAPANGSVLWSMTSQESNVLAADGGVRRMGELLAIDDGAPELEPAGGDRYRETVVVDPVSGELLSDGIELEEGQFLARTVDQGYLLSNRSGVERTFGFELRGFDGETVAATAAEAVQTSSLLDYLLPLDEAFVKLEPSGGVAGNSVLTVAPWGAEETHEVPLPRSVRGAVPSEEFAKSQEFILVPGAVVLIESPIEDRDGITVVGFH